MCRRRQWQPTPVLLPGKSHGRRGLVGCSPWSCWGSDTTEWLHFHFSLSCIGEGNGNPLQCSCLENPRDGVAWWAAVYGVAQSPTRLKRFSSSSSIHYVIVSFYVWMWAGIDDQCLDLLIFISCKWRYYNRVKLTSKFFWHNPVVLDSVLAFWCNKSFLTCFV